MAEQPGPGEAQNAVAGATDSTKLAVLLALIVIYCLIPIGSLGMSLWIMFFESANYYIENGDFVSLITWLASEPNSSIGILQQLIAPIAAAITGATLVSHRHSRFVGVVVAICCLAIVCALVVSTLFQLRSEPSEPGALKAVQAFLHGVANTLAVYVLFLLGIAGAFKPGKKQEVGT